VEDRQATGGSLDQVTAGSCVHLLIVWNVIDLVLSKDPAVYGHLFGQHQWLQ
jgi:hypothetical protein